MESTDIQTINQEKNLHYTMSFIGGIFAVYALLEHSNVFGSAETSNMILLVNDLLHWNLFSILIRIGSLIAYAAGIVSALWLAKYYSHAQKVICIVTDAAAVFILSIIPHNTPPIVALYPVGFAMSIQWCTFRVVEKNPSATTFSTGNFRQLVTNIFNYFTEGKREYLSNVKFYFFTMLSFHLGAAAVYIIQPYIPHYSIWLAYLPLSAALIQEKAIILQKNMPVEKIAQSAGSDEV